MNTDLTTVLDAMTASRKGLVAAIEPLSADDMEKARPGGWSVGRVLQHVIDSEVAYVKLVAHLRGLTATEIATTIPQDGRDAVTQLTNTREALVKIADGVDDETLYRLAPLGANEYSVLSVLENDADHDHEHAAQIARLVSPTAGA